MTSRSHFIKVRVNDDEYRALRRRADARGVTISEHVRSTVTAVHQSQDVASELTSLRELVRQAAVARPAGAGADDTATREMLLLLRELAAARDAQILARVRAQLGARGGASAAAGGTA
jgi:hypothetical protein